MKRISILVITVMLAFSAKSQDVAASRVPAVVKNSFAKQYPGTTGKWEKEDGKYEVNFTHDGNKMSVLFNANGSIEETETVIKTTDLPSAVTDYVKTNYKGKMISEASRISKSNGTLMYEAEVGGIDLLFDSNGKFIKKEKEEKDEKKEKD